MTQNFDQFQFAVSEEKALNTASYLNVQFFIICLHFFIAFMYFPLRAFYNSWVWLLIAPMATFFFFLFSFEKIKNYLVRPIDLGIGLIALSGVVSCILGIVLNEVKIKSLGQVFVHSYLPLSLFFLVRAYISESIYRTHFLLKIIIVIGSLFSLSIAIEYFLISIVGVSHLSFFWVKPEFAISYEVANVKTILLSRHKGAFLLILLFSVVFPMSFFKYPSSYINPDFNKTLGKAIVVVILFDLLVLNVKTALFSIPAIIIIATLFSNDKNGIRAGLFCLTIIGILVIGIIPDYFNTIKNDYFILKLSNGLTPIETILESFNILVETYQSSGLSLFFGGAVTPFEEAHHNLYGGFTEARLFSYPIYFGLCWVVPVLFVLLEMVWEIFRILAHGKHIVLGAVYFLMIISVFLDFHYGNVIYRGCLQFWLVSVAILSNYYEIIRAEKFKEIQYA